MLDEFKIIDNSADEDDVIPEPDKDLQKLQHLRHYLERGKVPWRRVSSWKKENLYDRNIVGPDDIHTQNGVPFPLRAHRFASSKNYINSLQARFMDDIANASIKHLYASNPQQSAFNLLSISQKILAVIFIIGFAFVTVKAPLIAIISLNIFVTTYFIFAIGYRAYLILNSPPKSRESTQSILTKEALPVITILLPLYRDASSLVSLSQHIDALDYPSSKKDIKLLIEADDDETINEAIRLNLDKRYNVVFIPPSKPRTKPKACNFGMHLARGELIVIYDAEDHPEKDQLIKAANAFHRADNSVICFQAHLNYYNQHENWLTRMFTLEYSLWFDWLLPALQRLNVPIPLGGTSNFFRTKALIEIGGWDPYNVTEDADLGLRLSKLGYRVEILDSTTFEEANCKTENWIRQRSRWMKGYLQTWFVHMRSPQKFVSTTGWHGLLSIQLFIAGNVLSALINPILWVVFVVWLATSAPLISQAFPGPLLWLNLFALTIGNLFFVFLAIIAPIKRGWYGLSFYGVTAPLYWLLTSVAAYKAVWQLIFRPHYWEKTDHVISSVAKKRREEAMQRADAK